MIKNSLHNIDLFKSLDKKQLEKLITISSLESFSKDSIIFHQGDSSDYLHILLEGEIQIYKTDDLGNQIIIGIFNIPSLFGEAASLQELPFPSSALSKSDIKLLKIKTKKFKEEFLNDITITQQIIYSLLGKVQLLQQNIHNNIAPTAKDKIVHFYEKNEYFATNLKQYEIASLLGISQETFSRNLRKLVNDGVLVKSENIYTMKN